MAGIRFGTLYSENRDVVEALAKLGSFHGISGTTQHQVAQLLQDRGRVSAHVPLRFHLSNESIMLSTSSHLVLSSLSLFPTKYLLPICIGTPDWIDKEFLPENKRRLKAAHSFLKGELQSLGIPYLERPAALFVWADLRKVKSCQEVRRNLSRGVGLKNKTKHQTS